MRLPVPLLFALLASTAPAAEGQVPLEFLEQILQGEDPATGSEPTAEELPIPGQAVPEAPSEPVAYHVAWNQYDTIIVIEPGSGLRRPAWIATRDRAEDELAVAYAGTAYVDERGDVHIDCRRARISGPMADQWSPDSFAVEPDGDVRIIDEQDPPHRSSGRITKRIPAETDHGLDPDYMRTRQLAKLLVEGLL